MLQQIKNCESYFVKIFLLVKPMDRLQISFLILREFQRIIKKS